MRNKKLYDKTEYLIYYKMLDIGDVGFCKAFKNKEKALASLEEYRTYNDDQVEYILVERTEKVLKD